MSEKTAKPVRHRSRNTARTTPASMRFLARKVYFALYGLKWNEIKHDVDGATVEPRDENPPFHSMATPS